MKKINIKWLYFSFYFFNLVNAYLLISGFAHPNISNYQFNIYSFLSSFIGNIGVLTLFLVIGLLLFRRSKGQSIYLLIITFILTILCLGLAVYTSIFSTFFKFSHLDTFKNPSTENYILFYVNYALKLITEPSQIIHLIPFVLFIIVFIFTEKGISYYRPYYVKLIYFIFSLIFIILPFFRLNSNINNTIYASSVNNLYGVNETGLYNYYLYDYYQYLFPQEKNDYSDEYLEIENYLASLTSATYTNPIDNLVYSKTNEYTNLLANKNLLIVQLEAINNFVINLVMNDLEVMPTLNKLANEGLYFNNFYSTSGIGNTSDAEFSALTGLYGNGNDLTIFRYSGSNYETLAKDFKSNGYNTFSLHGNTGDFYFRNQEHLNTLGFEKHYDLEYFQTIADDLPFIHSYLSDEFFFSHLSDILIEYPQYFAYAISLTSHSPYVPASAVKQYNWGNITSLASNYLDYCRYLDDSLAIFLAKAESLALLDDLVLVFYGDHTSSLFYDDYNSISMTKATELEYRGSLQKVPFIIYNKDKITAGVSNKVCGTRDVYRTLANLFGLHQKYNFGTDMLTSEPSYIYSPRNLDLWFDGGAYFYPSNTYFGNQDKSYYQKIIALFEKDKYYNDLILKTKYFK